MPDIVVVTGGSGFLASWCIKQLIESGYAVRMSLRTGKSAADISQALNLSASDAPKLTAFNADLGDDQHWKNGIAGARYVLHIASPTSMARQSVEDLTRLTTTGTLRVLEHALAAGVERVVLTSSTYAIAYPKSPSSPNIRTERDWTDTANPAIAPYIRAKTAAERAAWDFADKSGDTRRLAAINPAGIIGPLLTADVPDSMKLIVRQLNGKVPGAPKIAIPFVDVRDVADLHIRAMRSPDAGGQRFIASGQAMWAKDFAKLLKRELGPLGTKVKTRTIPNWLLRLAALSDPSVRLALPDLGVWREFSSDKARTILGWNARPLAETLKSAANSLASRGLVGGAA